LFSKQLKQVHLNGSFYISYYIILSPQIYTIIITYKSYNNLLKFQWNNLADYEYIIVRIIIYLLVGVADNALKAKKSSSVILFYSSVPSIICYDRLVEKKWEKNVYIKSKLQFLICKSLLYILYTLYIRVYTRNSL
jgi:hypothetical protein